MYNGIDIIEKANKYLLEKRCDDDDDGGGNDNNTN